MFLVNVPVVIVGLFLAARRLPETRSHHPAPVDVPGTPCSRSLIALLLPLTEGRAAGWPLWSWLPLAVFPFAGAAFLRGRAPRRTAGPHAPRAALAAALIPSVRRGLTMIVPFSIGFGGFMFVIAVALQRGAGLSPLRPA